MSELERAMAELERSYDITLEALGDALDLKDAETEGHSKRVTAFTMAIARAMELPHEDVRVIARGAFLHDVGKMAIPDAILRKPGRLTPEEQMLMREHAYLGYQMLRRIPFLREAANIVYSHQERFDGSGYPRGLKGDQIPLGARIFAVADTFDAITSDRPYRAAQSISAARREIQTYSGRQFDPKVVDTFISISEELWQQLRDEIDAQRAHPRSGTSEPKNAALDLTWLPYSEIRLTAGPQEEVHVSTVLTNSEIDLALKTLPNWAKHDGAIERVFQFDDFVQAMEFVNRIAAAAEAANHHPDILINYNKVTLSLVSHDSGGVTQRDIRMAGKINQVAGDVNPTPPLSQCPFRPRFQRLSDLIQRCLNALQFELGTLVPFLPALGSFVEPRQHAPHRFSSLVGEKERADTTNSEHSKWNKPFAHWPLLRRGRRSSFR